MNLTKKVLLLALLLIHVNEVNCETTFYDDLQMVADEVLSQVLTNAPEEAKECINNILKLTKNKKKLAKCEYSFQNSLIQCLFFNL